MTVPENAPAIAIPPVSRGQFFTLLVTIIGGFLAVIVTLIGVVYWGIDARLKSLEDHFQNAIVAGANVKQLLETAPTLQHDITETNKTVFELKGSMEALKPVPQQIQTLQQDFGKLQIQTTNIQQQIHTIPGAKP
jgi:sensor histidine kinase YesM